VRPSRPSRRCRRRNRRWPTPARRDIRQLAVNPTPPRDPRIGARPQQRLLPPPVGRAQPGRADKPQAERRSLGQRLRTAITDEEIDNQILRMFQMIVRGLINLASPRGSYLNILT
jgi:hypothetical protein